jgi:hypothetical protein
MTTLLLVDSNIVGHSDIISSVKDSVTVILIDHMNDTYSSLIDKIKSKDLLFTTIGIIQHGSDISTTYQLLDKESSASVLNCKENDPDLISWSNIISFFTQLKELYSTSTIDLISCRLYNNPEWVYIIQKLEEKIGINIRASSNDTGNLKSGGDWIQESDGVDIKYIYFTESINNFVGLLYSYLYFVAHPTFSSTVSTGSTVTLSATIGGGSVYIRWFRFSPSPSFNTDVVKTDAFNYISGSNLYTTSYTTPPLTSANNGERYQVWATEYDGFNVSLGRTTITSFDANVYVIEDPPVITAGPSNQSISEQFLQFGAYFAVNVNGTPPFTYQWILNGVNIPGASDSTSSSLISYSTPALTLEEAIVNKWSVFISNNAGNITSSEAYIITPPTIKTQPTNKYIILGSQITFSTVFFSKAPLTITWYKNGVSLPETSNVINEFDITSTLTINSATNDDNGIDYYCTATDGTTTLTSNTVYSYIGTAPINPNPVSEITHAELNKPLTLTFPNISGSVPMSYKWQLNFVDIPEASGTISTVPTDISYTLPQNPTLADTNNYYSLILSNNWGSDEKEIRLRVGYAATIINQPVSVIKSPGETATFSVTATNLGGHIMYYKWMKNGISVVPNFSTSSSYTTPILTAEDLNDIYTVYVYTLYGGETSNEVSITVISSPPIITQQPQSVIVINGNTTTFSVTASGGALSYQWNKNGSPITDATSNTYTTPSLGPSDNNQQYSVSVTNTAGTTISENASITIVYVPQITQQPLNVNIIEGNTATFSVDVSGTTPFTYQWRKNSQTIDNATLSTYTTDLLNQSNNNDTYSVYIENEYGNVTSNNATITIVYPPSITSQPTNVDVLVGSSASFLVTATGTGTLTYQWKKDGVNIDGETSDTLTITNTIIGDAGIYSVEVSNDFDTIISNNATLIIGTPPIIITQPQSISIGISIDSQNNPTATFSVEVSGIGPFTYQWKENTSNAEIAYSSSLTTSTYTSRELLSSNSGIKYSVVITNKYGSTISDDAIVTVGILPYISIQPLSKNIAEGSTTSFSVTASGTLPLLYTWKKNGEIQFIGSSNTYNTPIQNINDNNSKWSVNIKNDFGDVDSQEATLSVIKLITIEPYTPNIYATVGSNKILSVSATGASALTYQWYMDVFPADPEFGIINGATGSSYELTSITLAQNNKNYYVIIKDSYGETSDLQASFTINVGSAPTLTIIPSNIRGIHGTSQTVSVDATGSDTLIYSWKKNGQILNTNNKFIDITLEENVINTYTVLVSNIYGDISHDFTAFGGTIPTISLDLRSRYVLNQSDVTLEVNVVGTEPFTYIWQKDSITLTETSNSLVISSFTSINSGIYNVTVTNEFGSISSSYASIQIGTAPTIITQPLSQNIIENNNVTFTVEAIGTMPIQYQWKRNGIIIENATSSTYSISSVLTDDAGNYTVDITNELGTVQSNNAILVVGIIPIISDTSNITPGLTIGPGYTITFNPTISGTMPFVSKWYKDEEEIYGANEPSFETTELGVNDSGSIYKLVVTNNFGSAMYEYTVQVDSNLSSNPVAPAILPTPSIIGTPTVTDSKINVSISCIIPNPTLVRRLELIAIRYTSSDLPASPYESNNNGDVDIKVVEISQPLNEFYIIPDLINESKYRIFVKVIGWSSLAITTKSNIISDIIPTPTQEEKDALRAFEESVVSTGDIVVGETQLIIYYKQPLFKLLSDGSPDKTTISSITARVTQNDVFFADFDMTERLYGYDGQYPYVTSRYFFLQFEIPYDTLFEVVITTNYADGVVVQSSKYSVRTPTDPAIDDENFILENKQFVLTNDVMYEINIGESEVQPGDTIETLFTPERKAARFEKIRGGPYSSAKTYEELAVLLLEPYYNNENRVPTDYIYIHLLWLAIDNEDKFRIYLARGFVNGLIYRKNFASTRTSILENEFVNRIIDIDGKITRLSFPNYMYIPINPSKLERIDLYAFNSRYSTTISFDTMNFTTLNGNINLDLTNFPDMSRVVNGHIDRVLKIGNALMPNAPPYYSETGNLTIPAGVTYIPKEYFNTRYMPKITNVFINSLSSNNNSHRLYIDENAFPTSCVINTPVPYLDSARMTITYESGTAGFIKDMISGQFSVTYNSDVRPTIIPSLTLLPSGFLSRSNLPSVNIQSTSSIEVIEQDALPNGCEVYINNFKNYIWALNNLRGSIGTFIYSNSTPTLTRYSQLFYKNFDTDVAEIYFIPSILDGDIIQLPNNILNTTIDRNFRINKVDIIGYNYNEDRYIINFSKIALALPDVYFQFEDETSLYEQSYVTYYGIRYQPLVEGFLGVEPVEIPSTLSGTIRILFDLFMKNIPNGFSTISTISLLILPDNIFFYEPNLMYSGQIFSYRGTTWKSRPEYPEIVSISSSLVQIQPNCVQFYDYMFSDQTKFSSLAIIRDVSVRSIPPNINKTVGISTFEGCTNLTTFGYNITAVGTNAFKNCISLTNPSFHNSLSVIDTNAFENCIGLSTLDLQISGNIHIKGNAFKDCTGIKTVHISAVGDVVLDTDAFNGCTGITTVTVQSTSGNVTIVSNAFNGCTGITTVTVQSTSGNVTIVSNAFNGCTGIITVTVQSTSGNVTIASNAFNECSEITSIIINANILQLDSNAFASSTKVESIIIHANKYPIQPTIIRPFSNLKTLEIKGVSASLTNSSPTFFSSNTKLESITLEFDESDANQQYSIDTFKNLTSLKNVTIKGSTFTVIDNEQFSGCTSLETINIISAITTIGELCFTNCPKLSVITLIFNRDAVCNSYFNDLPMLMTVTISGRLTTLPIENANMWLFKNCTSLKTCNIGSALSTNMGPKTFSDCKQTLEIVNIHFGTQSTPALYTNSMKSYLALERFTLTGNVIFSYKVENDFAFGLSNLKYLEITGKFESTIIGSQNPSLETLKLNGGANYYINDYLFFNHQTLQSVTLGGNVDSIGTGAFYKCENLLIVDISKITTEIVEGIQIGDFAFARSGIRTITIPYSVTGLGKGYLIGCPNLTSVICNNDVLKFIDPTSVRTQVWDLLNTPKIFEVTINAIDTYLYTGSTNIITSYKTSNGNTVNIPVDNLYVLANIDKYNDRANAYNTLLSTLYNMHADLNNAIEYSNKTRAMLTSFNQKTNTIINIITSRTSLTGSIGIKNFISKAYIDEIESSIRFFLNRGSKADEDYYRNYFNGLPSSILINSVIYNRLLGELRNIDNLLKNHIKTFSDNLKLYTEFSPNIDIVIRLILVDSQNANTDYYKLNPTNHITLEFINQVNVLKTLFPSWAPNDGILTNQMNTAIYSDNDLYTPGTKTNKIVQPYKLPDEMIQFSIDGSTIRDIYDKIGKLNADITITKQNNIVYYTAKSSNCELLFQDATLIKCNGTIQFNLTNVYGPIYSDIIYDLYTTTSIYTLNTPTITFNSKSAIITGLSDLKNTRINLNVTNLILGDNCMENLNKCIVDINCTNLRIYDSVFMRSIDTSIIINCVNNITVGKEIFASTTNVSLTTNKELINMPMTPIFYNAGHRSLTDIGAIIKDATNIETNDVMKVRINTIIADTEAIFQLPLISITFRQASTLKEYDIIIQPKDWFWCYKLDNLFERDIDGFKADFNSDSMRYKYLPTNAGATEYCGLQHNFAPNIIRYKGFTFNKTSGNNGFVKVNAYFSTLEKARDDKKKAVLQALSPLFEILIDIAIFAVSAIFPPAFPLLGPIVLGVKLAYNVYEIVNVSMFILGSLEIISADVIDDFQIAFEGTEDSDRNIEFDEEILNQNENTTRAVRLVSNIAKKVLSRGASMKVYINPKVIGKSTRRATLRASLNTAEKQASIRILLGGIDEVADNIIKIDPIVIKKTSVTIVSPNISKVDNITTARYGTKQTMTKSVVISKSVTATKIIDADLGDAFRALKAEKILKVNPIFNANLRLGTGVSRQQINLFVKGIWDDLILRDPKLQYSVPSMLNFDRLLRSIDRFINRFMDIAESLVKISKIKLERAAAKYVDANSSTFKPELGDTLKTRIAKKIEDIYPKFVLRDPTTKILQKFDLPSRLERLRHSEVVYKNILSNFTGGLRSLDDISMNVSRNVENNEEGDPTALNEDASFNPSILTDIQSTLYSLTSAITLATDFDDIIGVYETIQAIYNFEESLDTVKNMIDYLKIYETIDTPAQTCTIDQLTAYNGLNSLILRVGLESTKNTDYMQIQPVGDLLNLGSLINDPPYITPSNRPYNEYNDASPANYIHYYINSACNRQPDLHTRDSTGGLNRALFHASPLMRKNEYIWQGVYAGGVTDANDPDKGPKNTSINNIYGDPILVVNDVNGGDQIYLGSRDATYALTTNNAPNMVYSGAIDLSVTLNDIENISPFAFASGDPDSGLGTAIPFTIKDLELPDTIRSIGSNAFRNTNIKTCIIPTSCSLIGSNAFASASIENLRIIDGIRIKIPKSVRVVMNSTSTFKCTDKDITFNNVPSIQIIDINDNITTYTNVFEIIIGGITNFEIINPKEMREIYEIQYGNVEGITLLGIATFFNKTKNLGSVAISGNNDSFLSKNNNEIVIKIPVQYSINDYSSEILDLVAFNNRKDNINYNESRNSTFTPSSGRLTGFFNREVTSVNISLASDSIFSSTSPNYVFILNSTRGIRNRTLNRNIQGTVIQEGAFSGNDTLTEVIIPPGITEIGPNAFANTALTTISIPSTVIIQADAFKGAPIKNIILNAGLPPSIDPTFFTNLPTNITISVPPEKVAETQVLFNLNGATVQVVAGTSFNAPRIIQAIPVSPSFKTFLCNTTLVVYTHEFIQALRIGKTVPPSRRYVSWLPLGIAERGMLLHDLNNDMHIYTKGTATRNKYVPQKLLYTFKNVQLLNGPTTSGIGGSQQDINPYKSGWICGFSASGVYPIL